MHDIGSGAASLGDGRPLSAAARAHRRFAGTTAAVAIAAASGAILTAGGPALGAGPTHPTGLYAGGGSAPAQVVRQLLDCFGNHIAGDGFVASTSFASNPPTPGLLPSSCSTPAVGTANVEGLYSSTSVGRGQQAFLAHDATQIWNGSGTTVSLPSVPPPYTDAASVDSYFTSYPYPQTLLAFTAGDGLLPGSPANPGTLGTTVDVFQTPITSPPVVTGTANVNYDSADFGPPIQVPFLETAVALAVNVNGLSLHQAQPTGGTSRVQLSTADVCAIFSGTVTDWSSTQQIAGYDASGNVTTVGFDQDNNPNWLFSPTPTPFALHSQPITVIYRSDSAGVAGTFTSWLNKACAPLDNGTNHYAAIFHGRTNTFANLFLQATGGALPVPGNFIPVVGNKAVAQAVGNTSSTAGAIGYVSPDYTKRYSALSFAPVTANIQNAYQRTNGLVHARAGASFVAPLPTSTDAGLKNIPAPAAGAGYAQWDLTAASIDPTAITAYPIVGFTYLNLYTCYAKGGTVLGSGADTDGTLTDRFKALQSFLGWLFPAGGANATVKRVVENNGFHELTPVLTAAVRAEYLSAASASRIGQPGTVPACSASAGGA